jgi:hypothetical protein
MAPDLFLSLLSQSACITTSRKGRVFAPVVSGSEPGMAAVFEGYLPA